MTGCIHEGDLVCLEGKADPASPLMHPIPKDPCIAPIVQWEDNIPHHGILADIVVES